MANPKKPQKVPELLSDIHDKLGVIVPPASSSPEERVKEPARDPKKV